MNQNQIPRKYRITFNDNVKLDVMAYCLEEAHIQSLVEKSDGDTELLIGIRIVKIEPVVSDFQMKTEELMLNLLKGAKK